HRVTHAHFVWRVAAWHHERVEVLHARRSGRKIRRNRCLAALAPVLRPRQRSDDRHVRSCRAERIERSSQFDIFKAILDEDGYPLAGQRRGLDHQDLRAWDCTSWLIEWPDGQSAGTR